MIRLNKITQPLMPTEAERAFLKKLRDFCRVHCTGRRVDSAMLAVAASWTVELEARLRNSSSLGGFDEHALSAASMANVQGDLGAVTLRVGSAARTKTGALVGMAYRRHPNRQRAELAMVARFADSHVTISVEVNAADVRRISQAA